MSECKTSGNGLGPKLVVLNALGIITNEEFNLLWAIKDFRNEAAHKSFVDFSESRIYQIDPQSKDVQTFSFRAVQLLWRKDSMYLASKFSGIQFGAAAVQ